jgi:replication initiation protein RepC
MSAAEVMRVGIGLSESAYTQACGRLGRQAAAAILAVVAEKALRDPEKISSPGGYFRACCDRAAEGKLALAKSLFGLAAK